MPAYYNEIDAYAAQWLRNLISANLIAPGDVDERDIRDIRPYELASYEQCHFFAGIGGWSIALRLAAWPDHRKVWTGSCPCQPFSAAGKAGGFTDERHLWPYWFWLIEQRRPEIVLGEQVASKAGLAWLDLVHADLEGAGYAVGTNDLCAAGVGAPHIRQRLWFVADAERGTAERWRHDLADAPGGIEGKTRQRKRFRDDARPGDEPGGMADTGSDGRKAGLSERGMASEQRPQGHSVERSCTSPWADLEWLQCTDGKARPTQPGLFPLAHGIQRRTSKLRAYGNAIVPQVAAEFIKAYMDCRP